MIDHACYRLLFFQCSLRGLQFGTWNASKMLFRIKNTLHISHLFNIIQLMFVVKFKYLVAIFMSIFLYIVYFTEIDVFV